MVKIHLTCLTVFVADTRPNSILFSFGIAKQCTKQWEILEFLKSGSSEVERGGLNLSILADLMGLQAMPTEISQHPFASDYHLCFHNAESQPTIFYPSTEFYFEKPLLDLVGNLAHKSEFMVHLDDQVAFAGARTEMKDILSIIAEFYLSKNSTKWRKQSLLVPQFDRYLCSSTYQNKNCNSCFFCFNQNFMHFEAYTIIWMLLDA